MNQFTYRKSLFARSILIRFQIARVFSSYEFSEEDVCVTFEDTPVHLLEASHKAVTNVPHQVTASILLLYLQHQFLITT